MKRLLLLALLVLPSVVSSDVAYVPSASTIVAIGNGPNCSLISVSAASDDGTPGTGDSVSFTSTVTGGAPGPYTYLWDFGDKPYSGVITTTSYWSMDEAAGDDRVDSVAGHDLTPYNSPESVAGKFGNSVKFAFSYPPPTAQYLSVAHHADLQGGDVDFSVAFWFSGLNDPTIDQYALVGVSDAVVANREWAVRITGFGSYTNHYRFTWTRSDGTDDTIWGPVVEFDGQQHFIHCWRDKTAQKIYLRIDFGAIYSADSAGGGQVGTAAFGVGARGNGDKPMDGSIDELYIYRGLWTDEEAHNIAGMSALANPTWKFSTAGAKTVTLTVTDSFGCSASDTVAETVS
jgi:hypothetical protein